MPSGVPNCDEVGATLVALRIALGAVLVFAGVTKLRSPRSSDSLLQALGLQVPVRLVAVGELCAGALVVMGSLVGLAAETALLLAFVSVLATAVHRGYRGACGCFGRADDRVLASLFRTTGLAVLAIGLTLEAVVQGCTTAQLVLTVGFAIALGLMALAAISLELVLTVVVALADARQAETQYLESSL